MDKEGVAIENWTIFHECHMCIIANGVLAITRKIAPRLGFGFALGLELELGFRAIFVGGNCPRTLCNIY